MKFVSSLLLYQQTANIKTCEKLLNLKFQSGKWKNCENKNLAALLRSVMSVFGRVLSQIYKDLGGLKSIIYNGRSFFSRKNAL